MYQTASVKLRTSAETSTDATGAIYIDPSGCDEVTIVVKNPTPGTFALQAPNADGTYTDPVVFEDTITNTSFSRTIPGVCYEDVSATETDSTTWPLRVSWTGNSGTVTVVAFGRR